MVQRAVLNPVESRMISDRKRRSARGHGNYDGHGTLCVARYVVLCMARCVTLRVARCVAQCGAGNGNGVIYGQNQAEAESTRRSPA